ncbi:hypothetical protein RCH09_003943 [Actimicrobium sp. GrIS 1.19]|uniref:hypothetical protein n=1 Tax=Actimicrobium sp. GrIS 1.19 TaxID=3071708 RepID=UPI002DF7B387|nr:hypothetical protein [Actimicrobium sp. GrIS 1.19]
MTSDTSDDVANAGTGWGIGASFSRLFGAGNAAQDVALQPAQYAIGKTVHDLAAKSNQQTNRLGPEAQNAIDGLRSGNAIFKYGAATEVDLHAVANGKRGASPAEQQGAQYFLDHPALLDQLMACRGSFSMGDLTRISGMGWSTGTGSSPAPSAAEIVVGLKTGSAA